MREKIVRYWNTLRYITPGQMAARVRKRLGLGCTLGRMPKPYEATPRNIAPMEELDFDPAFLSRFSATEFAEGKVCFLHESAALRWDEKWDQPDRTPLWNFNLHYCEFLHAFAAAYKKTGDRQWLDAGNGIIRAWISHHPREKAGYGWAAYTVAMRLTNWLFYFAETGQNADGATARSIHEQYSYLASHLEKDILGNHYLEDLKALILCSLYFSDEPMREKAVSAFLGQLRSQILPDGMHEELSPMYHKIMLECVLRAAWALRSAGKGEEKIEAYLSPMLNAAHSFEHGLDRVPLFNDGGTNVAKSLDALERAAERFSLQPQAVDALKSAGYYFFQCSDFRLVVDAGEIGPAHNPGHGHCDAMSYELFYRGSPLAVNGGTYAYQCAERNVFRGTSAHNTVMADGTEQSDCWSAFRVGRRSRIVGRFPDKNGIHIEMLDQRKRRITRTITLKDDGLTVTDESPGVLLTSFVHPLHEEMMSLQAVEGEVKAGSSLYAEEYGRMEQIREYRIENKDRIVYRLLPTKEAL